MNAAPDAPRATSSRLVSVAAALPTVRTADAAVVATLTSPVTLNAPATCTTPVPGSFASRKETPPETWYWERTDPATSTASGT
jgi:hypothetical protein